LPLVVGLGGHRDLRDQDVPILEARMGQVLTDLRRQLPHTPITLLSSLAEGADRLGARVALAHGCRLVAPLPLPREDYERDFATAASRAEFAELLARADAWLVVPADGPCNREHHYARAAAWMARRSQLVVALWDGRPARGEAGTGALVRFALEGVPDDYGEPRSALDVVERRPVVHVATRRSGDVPSEHTVGNTRWLRPESDDGAAIDFEGLWERIDELNRDAGHLAGPDPPRLATPGGHGGSPSRGAGLLPDPAGARLSRDLRDLEHAYGVADALSIRYQTLTRRTLAALLVLAFVAAGALQVGQLLPGSPRPADALYVLALAAAYGLWLWAGRAGHQTRHLDYRALAEGLRIQFFWRLAGVPGSVADHYLSRQRGELDWIRRVLRAFDLAPVPASTGNALGLVAAHWVKVQASYFTRAAHRNDGRDRTIRRAGYGFFAVALALGLGKLLVSVTHPALVVVGLAPVVGALCQVWADRLALGPLAKQYGRMSLVFSNAETRLASCLAAGDTAGARAIVYELGVEALGENADWVILHRERPLQLPGAQ
jgi:hypothetical protein